MYQYTRFQRRIYQQSYLIHNLMKIIEIMPIFITLWGGLIRHSKHMTRQSNETLMTKYHIKIKEKFIVLLLNRSKRITKQSRSIQNTLMHILGRDINFIE